METGRPKPKTAEMVTAVRSELMPTSISVIPVKSKSTFPQNPADPVMTQSTQKMLAEYDAVSAVLLTAMLRKGFGNKLAVDYFYFDCFMNQALISMILAYATQSSILTPEAKLRQVYRL